MPRKTYHPSQKRELHVTRHIDHKLEGLYSISVTTNNEWCNGAAAHIEGNVCAKCYARRLEALRPTLHHVLTMNARLLSEYPMQCLIPHFPRGSLVRFNAYGELLNEAHLWNLMDIAYDNPEVTFALWTKRIALAGPIVKPPNMITIYSQPMIDGPTNVPPGFDGTYVVHPGGSPCGDKCIECRACYGGSKAPFVIHQRLH